VWIGVLDNKTEQRVIVAEIGMLSWMCEEVTRDNITRNRFSRRSIDYRNATNCRLNYRE